MLYLDYNSTHPPRNEILRSALETYLKEFANSSGLSLASQRVNTLVEQCRERIAHLFGVEPGSVIFTSSASEANGLVLSALANQASARGSKKPRVLTSRLEHPSVSETLKGLPVEISEMPVSNHGVIEIEEALKQVSQADFCTMVAANSETGVIQPVKQFLENSDRPVVCDAVQLLPRMSAENSPNASYSFFSMLKQHNVYFSLAGHKVGAGFGAGLLLCPPGSIEFLKNNITYRGGSQEHEMRAGSHNLAAILALAETLTAQQPSWAELQAITEDFEEKMISSLEPVIPVKVVGRYAPRIPGTSLISFSQVPIDFFLMGLDQEEIIVSTGTSCKSRSRQPSPGLLAMGLNNEEALSVIRFSYSTSFSKTQRTMAVEKISGLVKRLVNKASSV